ncbi:thiol-disulfide oxidoreductase ResA [Gracilibacillus caseinilyticus]|uniref:Thiol-disulfide oxidoreductase ResA n=1 Tax=Gracilibacillus caseinilyticus TaxID=2932256 RepID=A0ABY4ESZ7_9BACI|nr:thiol-disulfide oxidoreductase ResA [Gracilibacillus caseinilyticus]UOQ47541.1 thiol-disulfide oxidoreductase ResA [Gracilibacillus caseinilyticus]
MSKIEQAKQNKKSKKRNRFIFRTSILIVLFGALLFAVVSNLTAEEDAVVEVGDQAPDFQLEQIATDDSSTIQLSDLRGKGVMLNFWGTWCKPCEKEMPYMEQLYPEYKEKGVEILAVNLDSTKLPVQNFVDQYNLTFPILYDEHTEVLDTYGIKPIPTTYFIDENGIVVERVLGGLTVEKLQGYLDQIVPEGS